MAFKMKFSGFKLVPKDWATLRKQPGKPQSTRGAVNPKTQVEDPYGSAMSYKSPKKIYDAKGKRRKDYKYKK